MTAPRSPVRPGLERRLRPHVSGEFDPSRYAWWPRERPGNRLVTLGGARRRRRLEAELPVVVEQLAELVSAGCGVAAATARVAWRGRGAVADDLAGVAEQLRAGRPPAAVWRQWGASSGSDAVGALACTLALDQPATDLADKLRRHAQLLRQRGHDERLAAVARRVWLVWLAACAQLAAIGIAVAA